MANDLLEFLQRKLDSLVYASHHVHRGEITPFRNISQELGGSVTVTQGIQVEAQALIQHIFCRFDDEIFEHVPKYFFVYNVRIKVIAPTRISMLPPPDRCKGSFQIETAATFKPCKLLVRNISFHIY